LVVVLSIETFMSHPSWLNI